MADEYGGTIIDVDGRPAIEIDTNAPLRSVAQVIDGVEVVVYGTLPIEDLRAIAASIG